MTLTILTYHFAIVAIFFEHHQLPMASRIVTPSSRSSLATLLSVACLNVAPTGADEEKNWFMAAKVRRLCGIGHTKLYKRITNEA